MGIDGAAIPTCADHVQPWGAGDLGRGAALVAARRRARRIICSIRGPARPPASGPARRRCDAEGTPLIATATALAPTAARAEVAAKVALLRGYPACLRAVESAWKRYGALGPRDDGDAGVALALVFGTGEIAFSRNLNEYLATWGTQSAMLPMMVGSALPPLTLAEMRQLEQKS